MKPPGVLLLRLEGLVGVVVGLIGYEYFQLPWRWFLVYFLVPDLSLLAYFINPRLGAWIYNLAHTYAFPLAAIGVGVFAGYPIVFATGMVHCVHIAFDRALGMGLKSPENFKLTHLGPIGRKSSAKH